MVKQIGDSTYENFGEKICISGSMKFYEIMLEVAHNLSRKGAIVLLPFNHVYGNQKNIPSEDDKVMLVKIHEERINMCDYVYVVNINGYIGKATQDEIDYANSINKEVRYMVDLDKPIHTEITKIVTLCGSGKFKDIFEREAERLKCEGYHVMVPTIFEFDTSTLSKAHHNELDSIHRAKMRMSEFVFIINPNGYIGTDTKAEIDYCIERGIKLKYLVEAEEE